MDDETSEPFSLDLDIVLSEPAGQPDAVEPEVIQECVEEEPEMDIGGNEPEFIETTEPELQETCEIQAQTQRDKTLYAGTPLLQRDTLMLIYDTPGHPSVITAPTVRYVSCLYKWIGFPAIT